MEPIDWSALRENCAGDDTLVAEVVELFQQEAPALLSDVHEAVAQHEPGGIKRTAHRLKGALVSLAAQPSVNAARELEQMGSANDLAHVDESLAKLEAEMAKLLVVLRSAARAA